MKKILISAALAIGLVALSGCDSADKKDKIIAAQAQQIAVLQQQVSGLTAADSAAPATEPTAAAVAPVAPAASPQVVTAAPAPVVIQQQPTVVHERDGTGDLVTGMMLGHMLSGGGGGGGYASNHASNHTTTHVVNNYHAPAAAAPAKPVAKSAPAKRSWSTGSTASRPTYRRSSFSSGARSSFYSSRSSFRSGRR